MKILPVAAAIALFGVSSATAQVSEVPIPVFMVPEDQAPMLFEQCPMDTPDFTGQTWRPETALVAEMDAQVRALLDSHWLERDMTFSAQLDGTLRLDPQPHPYQLRPSLYVSQVIGLHTGIGDLVCAYYVPASDENRREFYLTNVAVIADSGPSHFTVLFDPQVMSVRRIDFDHGWTSADPIIVE